MEYFIYIIVGILGVALGYYLSPKPKKDEIKERMQKIMKHLEKEGKVTNDEVEELLGVSDATATRYLSALEKEGLIEQVGEEGRGVYYRKK